MLKGEEDLMCSGLNVGLKMFLGVDGNKVANLKEKFQGCLFNRVEL